MQSSKPDQALLRLQNKHTGSVQVPHCDRAAVLKLNMESTEKTNLKHNEPTFSFHAFKFTQQQRFYRY